jgi:hypothetical protein
LTDALLGLSAFIFDDCCGFRVSQLLVDSDLLGPALWVRGNSGEHAMSTVPTLVEHLTDITERLARLVTAVDLLNRAQAAGEPVDLTSLRAGIEKAHAHAEGLLQEVRTAEGAQ